MCGSRVSLACRVGLMAGLVAASGLAANVPHLRGKCPLELAGYDLTQIPLTRYLRDGPRGMARWRSARRGRRLSQSENGLGAHVWKGLQAVL